MGRNSLNTVVALVMLAGFAAKAGAQEGIVTPRAQRAVAVQSNSNERRPPQAPPPDPSKDPNAPPDVRQIRRAVGGFVGGLIGFGPGSLLAGIDPTRGFSVAAGIGLGVWIGGR
jgi:hypothetical protein